MYREHTVGVVVPAYNEHGFVGEVIETVPSFVDRVYVVDDRSTDGTWNEILAHADQTADEVPRRERSSVVDEETPVVTRADGGSAARTHVVAVRHAENRGVGGAISTGYRHAVADDVDVTAVMAGDGQMDPDQLDRLLDPVVDGRAEYAKGNRLLGREYYDEMSPFRRFGNVTLSILTKIASGYWAMLDPQNGYTAISREALEAIDLDDLYEEYGFSNDLLVALNSQEFPIADVAMPAVYGDERSHIEYRSFVPKLSWLLWRRFLHRLGIRYVLRDFHPLVGLYGLAALGVAIGAAGLGWALGRRGDDSGRPAAVLSAIGLLLWSTISLFLAMIFDREANEELVVSDE